MEKNSRDVPPDPPLFLGEDWFDPIEAGIRGRVRGFIEELIEEELSEALGRTRYQRPGQSAKPEASQGAAGYRHGRRERQVLGSFGPVRISVPRARLVDAEGGVQTGAEGFEGLLRFVPEHVDFGVVGDGF